MEVKTVPVFRCRNPWSDVVQAHPSDVGAGDILAAASEYDSVPNVEDQSWQETYLKLGLDTVARRGR